MELVGFILFAALGAVGGYLYARKKCGIKSGGASGSGGSSGGPAKE